MKRVLIPVVGAVLLASVSSFAGAALNTQMDKVSYSIGVMTGRAFIDRKMAVNEAMYVQGFKDGLSGAATQLTSQQMRTELSQYRKQQQEKRKQMQQQQASDNEKLGATYLQDNKAKPGVSTTASGLQYKVIETGSGDSPQATDSVTVNYEGKLTDGTVFDSSYKRGKPVTFPVNGVIKGWQEALQMMKPGAVWEVVIPSDLGYGKMGMPGSPIGPNATLVFKINLISVDKK